MEACVKPCGTKACDAGRLSFSAKNVNSFDTITIPALTDAGRLHHRPGAKLYVMMLLLLGLKRAVP